MWVSFLLCKLQGSYLTVTDCPFLTSPHTAAPTPLLLFKGSRENWVWKPGPSLVCHGRGRGPGGGGESLEIKSQSRWGKLWQA